MPTLIVPIKVKIALRPNGHADHPAWERLPMIASELVALASELGRPVTREEVDGQVRKRVVGSWCYDKTSGHQTDTPDSPYGMQWGMLLVTKAFADEAVATFPGIVTIMTQTECRTFWDNKAMVRLTDEDRDHELLQALLTERQLRASLNQTSVLATLDARIARALDPDDPEPGVKRNFLRRWATAKVRLGVDFDPTVLP